MKTNKSLQAAQREMRQRQHNPGRPGRPQLSISREDLLELWARGYSPRGMAIHFGCDERTVQRRLSEYFPKELKLQTLPNPMLYYLAINSDDSRFVIQFLRRYERREYRRTGMHRSQRM
jgi:hypothetical protein